MGRGVYMFEFANKDLLIFHSGMHLLTKPSAPIMEIISLEVKDLLAGTKRLSKV